MTLLAEKFNMCSTFMVRKSANLKHFNISTLVAILQITLVVFIGQQLSIMTWQMFPGGNQDSARTPSSVSTPSVARSQNNSKNQLAALSSLHLFGTVQKQAPQKVAAPTTVPVSRLAAKITGLVASSNPKQSLVIIRSGSSDNTYTTGDMLKGTRYRIETIYPDRVIISNGTKLESLLMYPDDEKIKTTQVIRMAPQGSPQDTQRNIGTLAKMLREKPSSWSEIVTISPVRANGKLQGYRVNPARNRQYFDQLGLKPNDIATAINGYDLTNNSEALKIISQLPTLEQVSLTIERDGQRFEVDLSA